MTPEGKVKANVKALLKERGAYWHCPVQNGMGAPSLDFVGCHKIVITPEMVGMEIGRYYSVETKAGSKQPTPRQELTINDMRKSGARVFVVNEFSGLEELEEWLKEV